MSQTLPSNRARLSEVSHMTAGALSLLPHDIRKNQRCTSNLRRSGGRVVGGIDAAVHRRPPEAYELRCRVPAIAAVAGQRVAAT